MMRLILFVSVLFVVLRVDAQLPLEKEFPRSFKVQVVNPLSAVRESVLVVVTPDQLRKVKGFNTKAFVVISGGMEIPAQYNVDDLSSGIVFVLAGMQPKEACEIVIRYNPSGT